MHPTTSPSLHHPAVHPHPGPLTHHEKLVKNAQRLVANTFYGTLLKQMHNSPFKSKLFEGGRGGEVFGSLLDQHLVDRMSGAPSGRLVNAMVKRWEHPPANDHGSAKQRAINAGWKQTGPKPDVQWRQYVPADYRA